jgi:DedD protein
MAEPQDALLLKRRARRRLVGAIALVLLVVIVLPVVLDQEPTPMKHDLTVQIPGQDAGKFGARVLQKPGGEAAEKGARPTAPSAEKGAPSKAGDSEAERALALLNDESYVVPLGAFANPGNAKQVRDKVAAAGFKTYTETIQGKDGAQTRVRAGPFATRDSAEKAREKLKALGVSVGQVAPR